MVATVRQPSVPVDRQARVRERIECRDLLGNGWVASIPLVLDWDPVNNIIAGLVPIADEWKFEPESNLLIRQETLAVAGWKDVTQTGTRKEAAIG